MIDDLSDVVFLMGLLQFQLLPTTAVQLTCLPYYPKYGDTLTPYHTYPKIWKKSILYPVDVSKMVLDEWQTV